MITKIFSASVVSTIAGMSYPVIQSFAFTDEQEARDWIAVTIRRDEMMVSTKCIGNVTPVLLDTGDMEEFNPVYRVAIERRLVEVIEVEISGVMSREGAARAALANNYDGMYAPMWGDAAVVQSVGYAADPAEVVIVGKDVPR